jgi:hypothetical protein
MRQSTADDLALITRWTRNLSVNRRERAPGRFGLRLSVTFGFSFLALLASCAGSDPKPTLGLALFAILLIYELPAAVLARVRGRAVHVWITSTGSRTDILGQAVPGLARFGHAVVGSGLSLAIGFGLLRLARVMHSPELTEFGRLQLFWGAVQLVPFRPFKLGNLLKDQLGHWARVKHAIASLGLVLATLVRVLDRLEVPFIFIACSAWLFVCVRELFGSIALARDAGLSPATNLAEIARLTCADEPRRALRLAHDLLDSAHSVSLQSRASIALAWAAIGAGDIDEARGAMTRISARDSDAHLLAAYLATIGRRRGAIALLESAEGASVRSVESLKLLADLYYREGESAKLLSLLDSASDLLSDAELSRIQRALETLPPTTPSDCLLPAAARRYEHAF